MIYKSYFYGFKNNLLLQRLVHFMALLVAICAFNILGIALNNANYLFIMNIGIFCFSLFFLILYSKKEWFIKMSLLFSKWAILCVVALYVGLVISSIYQGFILEKHIKSNAHFKHYFPSSFVEIQFEKSLVLMPFARITMFDTYDVGVSLDEQIAFIKQLDGNIELQLYITSQTKITPISILYLPCNDCFVGNINKIFIVFVLYFYSAIFYWMLRQYLKNDAKLIHTIPVLMIVCAIFFKFFVFSTMWSKLNDTYRYTLSEPATQNLKNTIDIITTNHRTPLDQKMDFNTVRTNFYLKFTLEEKR